MQKLNIKDSSRPSDYTPTLEHLRHNESGDIVVTLGRVWPNDDYDEEPIIHVVDPDTLEKIGPARKHPRIEGDWIEDNVQICPECWSDDCSCDRYKKTSLVVSYMDYLLEKSKPTEKE